MHALQRFHHHGVYPLHGGHGQGLPEGVDLLQVGAEGHAVQTRQLGGEQAALQTGVDGLHLGGVAVLVGEHLDHQVPQGGLGHELPAGVFAVGADGAAQAFRQAAEAVDEHLLLGGDAAADAEGGVDRIVTGDGFRRFVEVLENDPEGLADYLSDPVSMETVPVYEITSYGSSMAPYYIMLALFVGSLLTATMLHVNAPMPELFRLRPWQRFFGRYQLFFLIGMIQALVTGLGCIYYIGIQCPYPGLFLLACCVCSLNFTMMNYALVYALDNIGMAASVIIMVIQVAGSGGVYPIDVLPGIFQTLYKFMPFHYGMDMLRETIAGRYENVYWKNLAVMAAMCVLFAVLGMVLYYPARPLNRLIARSKEKSGIM